MINVEELTAKIEEQGKRNVVEKDNKRKLYLQSLKRKVEVINGYREDAEGLIRIFKALKQNGLEYIGNNAHEYIADGWSHRIGFAEFKDGSVCLRVCGGGCCGDNQLLFLRNGNDAECAYYEVEKLIGDAWDVVGNPERYGITDRWVGSFEQRLNTMIKEFEKFRDDYIAYAKSQLSK